MPLLMKSPCFSPNGPPYDPIYVDSVKPVNIAHQTVYSSSGLLLIAVCPFWAVALKIVRYQKDDPADICAILLAGASLTNGSWTPELLEKWLWKHCWSMGYAGYDQAKIQLMRERLADAVKRVGSVNWSAAKVSSF